MSNVNMTADQLPLKARQMYDNFGALLLKVNAQISALSSETTQTLNTIQPPVTSAHVIRPTGEKPLVSQPANSDSSVPH